MVLLTKRGNELPPNSVKLTEDEAVTYQKNFIKNWPAQQEVFFLNYGKYVCAASTFISSALIFRYFKRTFNLPNTARTFFAVLPSTGIPTFCSLYFTDIFLTNNIVVLKMDCPLCYQLKFSLAQFYISIVYPALYGHVALSSTAFYYGSYSIPSLTKYPREFWRESFKILKNGSHTFQVLGILQTAVMLFLPFIQNKEILNVTKKAQDNSFIYEEDNFLNEKNNYELQNSL